MKETLAAKFTAKSDAGHQYTILEYQAWINAGSHDDPNAKIAGLKRLVTSDGRAVNMQDAKTFEIVDTGEILRVP